MTPYEALRKNYDELSAVLTRIEREVNRAIRENHKAMIAPLTKVQMLLVSIKSEVALQYVIHMSPGFPTNTRQNILANGSALQRWKATIDAAFRLHYGVKAGKSLEDGLSHDALAKWKTLHELVDSELEPLISNRNNLAHGQWARILDPTFTRVETTAMARLNRENALSLKFHNNLIEQLTVLLGDLIRSPKTFESHFEQRYVKIRENRRSLVTVDYRDWFKSIQKTRKMFPVLVDIYVKKHGWHVVDSQGIEIDLQ